MKSYIQSWKTPPLQLKGTPYASLPIPAQASFLYTETFAGQNAPTPRRIPEGSPSLSEPCTSKLHYIGYQLQREGQYIFFDYD